MDAFLQALQNTPIPNLLVLAGLLFVLLGFVNRLGGFLEVSAETRKLTLPVGLFVLTIGLLLSLFPLEPGNPSPPGPQATETPPPVLPRAEERRAVTDDPNPPTNVCNGVGSHHTIIARLRPGDVFHVIPREGQEWWAVRTAEGQRGYVHRTLIRVLE